MSYRTIIEIDHSKVDEIERNKLDFLRLMIIYLRTRDVSVSDELCDRFRFRFIPAFEDETWRYVLVGNVTYLLGGNKLDVRGEAECAAWARDLLQDYDDD